MKRKITALICLGILIAGFFILSGFSLKETVSYADESYENLKQEVFEILDSKCNVCHRRKNPFMIFKLKNMEKRAEKIDKAVFKERRMPKGNDIRLTDEEYSKMKNWLIKLSIQ